MLAVDRRSAGKDPILDGDRSVRFTRFKVTTAVWLLLAGRRLCNTQRDRSR